VSDLVWLGRAGDSFRQVLALVAHTDSATNAALAACRLPGLTVRRLAPADAVALLQPGDVALGRLDVCATVDGVEDGLAELAALDERGVLVLNGPSALMTSHDKLLTARALRRAGLPHPATGLIFPDSAAPLEPPVVVKPRFGSWGRDVLRCDDAASLRRALKHLESRPWFRTQGALVQDLIPPRGYDVRIVVAGGEVVGAIQRCAAPGEWRTNVQLGGTRMPVDPSPQARELALAAAAAAGADLVGVDLLPAYGGYVVIEINGAVDFTREYALAGVDPFQAAMAALASAALDVPSAALDVPPLDPALAAGA
jgi:RimK family alpha-L-glutamate ligase